MYFIVQDQWINDVEYPLFPFVKTLNRNVKLPILRLENS